MDSTSMQCVAGSNSPLADRFFPLWPCRTSTSDQPGRPSGNDRSPILGDSTRKRTFLLISAVFPCLLGICEKRKNEQRNKNCNSSVFHKTFTSACLFGILDRLVQNPDQETFDRLAQNCE